MTTNGLTIEDNSPVEIVTHQEEHDGASLNTPLIVASPVVRRSENHTFGQSLLRYITSKIPIADLPQRPSRVIVRPYRSGEELYLSLNTKTDKLFNRQRPYLRYVEPTDTLEVLCIPGNDSIKHYASLVATYYGLVTFGNKVLTQYSLPRRLECDSWLRASNLRELSGVRTVVLGYVERLNRAGASPQCWNSGIEVDDPTRKLFAWQIHRPTDSDRGFGRGPIAFLGCLFNFWGDIAASLVQVLHQLCHVHEIIYIGKAGSLREDDEPNNVISTGNTSWLNDAQVTWNDALQRALSDYCPPEVQTGENTSVFSPIEETHEWLSTWRKRSRWVDCEVGYLAQACNNNCISFGYLNIISDNVARWYEHDLSNERLEIVQEKRKGLLSVIESVLDRHLGLPPVVKRMET
ncbi:hypothetical protein LTR70_008822 [Exophiala xenobiotica]|uniref:Uncharacterized protein n=1 Tax=Lithohypha guttulata TaxID=1690604 RepID=A0ABR0JYH6_9EURO|nr:hypothetical protein LTR24_008968 [Lithohypha guttulata]KAK5311400.1 hypothetical protein LTR70_008822 [Exophiala xenobiotica]